MIKRLISSIFILLFTLPALMAISSSDIYFADKEMLENMSIMRGLEIKSEDEMRSALYSYEGLEAYSVEESSKESQYNLDLHTEPRLTHLFSYGKLATTRAKRLEEVLIS